MGSVTKINIHHVHSKHCTASEKHLGTKAVLATASAALLPNGSCLVATEA